MNARVRICFTDPATLSVSEVDSLFAFASRYLVITRPWFESRLAGCTRLIIYRDRATGDVVGTTAVEILDLVHQGQPVRVLYTGAVILERAFRGDNLIPRAGLFTYLNYGLMSGRPVYWFCECDSFRGYRAVVKNFDSVWPRANQAEPPFESTLLTTLCQRLFGDAWDPVTQVCSPLVERQLRPFEATIPAASLSSDEDVSFFVVRNPGYQYGYALPVLTRLLAGYGRW